VEKTNFTSFSMVPANWDFADAQAGPLREEKQFDIKSETVDASGFDNRPTHIEAECFEPTLRVRERQTRGKAY
jgi:hypothetical protein